MASEPLDYPLIQIDDLVRPMNETEYLEYVSDITSKTGAPELIGLPAESYVLPTVSVEETPVVDDLVEGEQP